MNEKRASSGRRRRQPRGAGWVLLGLGILLQTGCVVPIQEQRLVSKPNMQFSRSAIYSYSSRVLPQLQAGLAISGGARASACTVCQ